MRAKQFTTEAAIGTNPKRPARAGSRPDRGHEPQKRYVTDRKTGKQYDPDEEFDKLKNSPEFQAQMKRMATKEGTVHQFPKKHKGDLDSIDDCPKCGGDLQGGKYMGHEVKVCMPCKQVYLPPNSGIDQQGNKMADEGFDYTMKDLGNDYAGFPSNHSLKHKFLAKIKPEKQQLYKDKMNNMHEFDQLFQLFKVAKQRGDIIEQGVAEGAPIVVMPRADRLKKAEPTKVRYQGDIVPPTKPPSTEKRGVKGRPGQRPMPQYEQGVAEAGNKALEPHIGMGDSRTPRELKNQMKGASDEFVKSNAGKKPGVFHSKVSHMQSKLAKSELRKRNQSIEEEMAQMEAELEEHGKASRELCKSSKPDADLGASMLSSCKSQGLRARDGNKSHKLGKTAKSRVKVGGHRIKGNKYGGPLPDWS